MWSKGGSRRARSGDNAGRTRCCCCCWGRGAQPGRDEASPPWQGRRGRVAVCPGHRLGHGGDVWLCSKRHIGRFRSGMCSPFPLLEKTKKITHLLSRWYVPVRKEAKLSLKVLAVERLFLEWFERNCERFLPWKRLQSCVHMKEL